MAKKDLTTVMLKDAGGTGNLGSTTTKSSNVKKNLPDLTTSFANALTQGTSNLVQKATSVPTDNSAVRSLAGSSATPITQNAVRNQQNRVEKKQNLGNLNSSAVSSLVGSNASQDTRREAALQQNKIMGAANQNFSAQQARSKGNTAYMLSDIIGQTNGMSSSAVSSLVGSNATPEQRNEASARVTSLFDNATGREPVKQVTQWETGDPLTNRLVNYLDQTTENQWDKADTIAQQAEQNYGQYLTPVQRTVSNVITNIEDNTVRMGKRMALSFLTGGSSLVGGIGSDIAMYLSSAGEALKEARDKGIDDDTARKYASVVGIANAGLEHLGDPTNTEGYGLGLDEILDEIIESIQFLSPKQKWVAKWFAGGFEEGLEELLTEAATQKAQRLLLDEDISSEQQIADRMNAFGMGMASALFLSGAVQGDMLPSGYEKYAGEIALDYLRMNADDQVAAIDAIAREFNADPAMIERSINDALVKNLGYLDAETLGRAVINAPVIVNRDGTAAYEYFGERTKEQNQALKAASRSGNEAYLVETLGRDSKGNAIPEATLDDGTVLLSAEVENPLSVALHSVIHVDKNADFISAANQAMREIEGKGFDKWFDSLKAAYAPMYTDVAYEGNDPVERQRFYTEQGRQIYESDPEFRQKMDEEVAAYFAQYHLFKDQKAFNRFINRTGNLLQRGIQSLKDNFGTESQGLISDLENQYTEMVRNYQKANNRSFLDRINLINLDNHKLSPDLSYSLKSMGIDIAEGTDSEMVQDLLRTGVFQSNDEARVFVDNVNQLMDLLSQRAFLDMHEEADRDTRAFQPIKKNSDKLYEISLDYSTLCKKRIITQAIIEKLNVDRGQALDAKTQFAITELLRQYQAEESKLQVACALCYVEAARLKSPKVINQFINNPAKYMTSYFVKQGGSEGKQIVADAQNAFKTMLGVDPSVTKQEMADDVASRMTVGEFNDVLKSIGTNEIDGDPDAMMTPQKVKNAYNNYVVQLRESLFDTLTEDQKAAIELAKSLDRRYYLTAQGLTDLKQGKVNGQFNPLATDIYNAFTNRVTTATRSKAIETDVAYYYGDAKAVSDSLIERMNAENGLRTQSWSDFTMQHLLDEITSTAELATRNAKMHGYTKVPEYVLVKGKTGEMINNSLIPEGRTGFDEYGNLAFSPTEGMPIEESNRLREIFPDTDGSICIGINDDQIRALLRDDRIDYVIPYHVSGLTSHLRTIAGINKWSNYTGVQNETPIPGRKQGAAIKFSDWYTDDIKNQNKSGLDIMMDAQQNYLDLCAERGYIPKFPQFLINNGDGTYSIDPENPNYWKLLIDRKMINQLNGKIIEQKAVRPDFNWEDTYVNGQRVPGLFSLVREAEDPRTSELVERMAGVVQNAIDDGTIDAIAENNANVRQVMDYFIKNNPIEQLGDNEDDEYEWNGDPFDPETRVEADVQTEVAPPSYDLQTNVGRQYNDIAAAMYSLSPAQEDYFSDSQVRDDNGNLLEVYHGSPTSGITEFDPNRAGEHSSAWGDKAVWFTDQPDFAREFSREFLPGGSNLTMRLGDEEGEVYPAYLNMTNPLDFRNLTDGQRDLFRDNMSMYGERDRQRQDDIINQLLEAGNHQYLKSFLDYDAAREQGYDGIIDRLYALGQNRGDGLEYGVFNPNQIKSLDNLNPTENNDIRYSLGELDDNDVKYSLRVDDPPQNTKTAYKLMRLMDGKLYPLFIGNNEAIEVGQWYDAESPNLESLKNLPAGTHLLNMQTGEAISWDDYKNRISPTENGKPNRKTPNIKDIHWANENGLRFMEIVDKAGSSSAKQLQQKYGDPRAYYNWGVNGSGTSKTGEGTPSKYALRPGWHFGEVPSMRQIGYKGDSGENDTRLDNQVWVEVAMSADRDYNDEARANASGDIPTHIPVDGYYQYATNPTQKKTKGGNTENDLTKGNWFVAGSFMPVRILSDSEADAIVNDFNRQNGTNIPLDYRRAGNRVFNAETMQVEDRPDNMMFSLDLDSANAYPDNNYPQSKGDMKTLGDIYREQGRDIDPYAQESVNPSEWEEPYQMGNAFDFLTETEAMDQVDEKPDEFYQDDDITTKEWYKMMMENEDDTSEDPDLEEVQMFQSFTPEATGAKGANKVGSISGFKDLAKQLDYMLGKDTEQRQFARDELERPFSDSQRKWTQGHGAAYQSLYDVSKKTGVWEGTKESAAAQWLGEGVKKEDGVEKPYTLEDLKKEFPDTWENIVEFEQYARKTYQDYIDKVNAVRREIYGDPNERHREDIKNWQRDLRSAQNRLKGAETQEDIDSYNKEINDLQKKINDTQRKINNHTYEVGKFIIPRQNYYHHFNAVETAGLGTIKNILKTIKENDTNAEAGRIDPELVPISRYTKPKTKWQGAMQRRGNGEYTADAVGGLRRYIDGMEYAIAYDPLIAHNRDFVNRMIKATKQTKNANALIQYLSEWTNSIAGKTSPFDRFIIDNIANSGNRGKVLNALEKINQRGKANAVVGNVRSAVSQIFNIPNARSIIKSDSAWLQGIKDYYDAKLGNRELLDQSPFLAERYQDLNAEDFKVRETVFDKLKGKTEDFFNKMMEFGDREAAELIWLSAYNEAVEKGIDDKIFYADDMTRRSVGGRGVGEVPYNMKSKLANFVMPFQLESNNQWQNLKQMVEDKDASGVFRLMMATYLMNIIPRFLFNDNVLPDVMDALVQGIRKLFDKDREETVGEVLGQTAQGLAGETVSMIPGASLWLPLLMGDNAETFFGDSSPTRYGTGAVGLKNVFDVIADAVNGDGFDAVTPLLQLGLPYGGKQASRLYNTLQDFNVLPSNGVMNTPFGGETNPINGDYTKKGALKYELPEGVNSWDDAMEIARAFMFGSNATNAAQEYYDTGKPALSAEKVQKLRDDPNLNPEQYMQYLKEANTDGKNGINQAEAAEWIGSHDLTPEEAEALWSATNSGWKKTYEQYSGNAPTEDKADTDKPSEYPRSKSELTKVADANGNGTLTQAEAYDWLSKSDIPDSVIAYLWSKMGWKTSYEDYKKNHSS